MDLIAQFWHLTRTTWGGLPIVLAINLVQLTLLGWVLWQRWLAGREQQRLADPTALQTQAVLRLDAWDHKVRPLVMTMMLVGPGVGLAMSTLLGALGMGALGEAMTQTGNQAQLTVAMAEAYREISYAYFLMVGGTPPMLLGPIIVLLARGFREAAQTAQGGEPEEMQLLSLERLRAAVEAQTALSDRHALRTLALLEQIADQGAPHRDHHPATLTLGGRP